MMFWLLFILFSTLFFVSFLKEKRLFRNAIYFTLSLMFLFFGVASASDGTGVQSLIIAIVYLLIPLSLIFISFVFIFAGFTSIKREGFSLSHSLSILFGIGVWILFGSFVALAMARNTLMIALSVLIIFMASYIIFTFFALFIYSQLYRFIPKNTRCDFIIVHGAGLIDGYRVSPLLAGRLNKGIEAFEQTGGRAKIIVSGGQGSDEKISEAEAMSNYLLEQGIKQDSIILENKSTTTFENLMYAKQIMDQLMDGKEYSSIFVTNDYHVFRTGIYARKIGLKSEGLGSKTAFYYWPNAFIREYIAIIIRYKVVPIIIFIIWLLITLLSLSPFNF